MFAIAVICSSAAAAPTGLNTIPTTDIVPLHNWVGQVQNGNSSLSAPAFYQVSSPIFQTQFGLSQRLEAGADWIQPPSVDHQETTLNAKYLLFDENEGRPGVALGAWNVAFRQKAGYYFTLSKTLNYAQQEQERFKAHHRRNRKLLGRRAHIGLTYDGGGVLQPFLGTDLQLNGSDVLQADWISGKGNAVSLGAVFVMRDQKTVLNPALLYSNDTQRLSGFFLNVSREFGM